MAVSQSLSVTESSYNIANNTSVVHIKWTSTQSGDSWNGYSRTAYYYVSINGGAESSYSVTYTLPKNTTQTIVDTNITVTHRNDGTGSVKVRTYMETGISAGTVQRSQNLTLTTIPRASIISATSGTIGKSTTVSISRYADVFTHTLRYTFGQASGNITTGLKANSYSWTIPGSIGAQIPNSTQGTGTIYCDTYSGSTLVGTTSATLTLTVDSATSAPTVTLAVTDANTATTALTGDANKLVKYFSNAKVTATGTALHGSTIKSYKVTCGDGKSITSATGTINGVESGTFTATVTDSRGFSKSISVSKTLVDYVKLGCIVTTTPPAANDNKAIIQVWGDCFEGSFGKVANAVTVQYRYKESGGTYSAWTNMAAKISGGRYSATVTLTNLDNTKTYIVQGQVTDKLATVTSAETTMRTLPVFDWGRSDFNFNVPVNVNGQVSNHGWNYVHDGNLQLDKNGKRTVFLYESSNAGVVGVYDADATMTAWINGANGSGNFKLIYENGVLLGNKYITSNYYYIGGGTTPVTATSAYTPSYIIIAAWINGNYKIIIFPQTFMNGNIPVGVNVSGTEYVFNLTRNGNDVTVTCNVGVQCYVYGMR